MDRRHFDSYPIADYCAWLELADRSQGTSRAQNLIQASQVHKTRPSDTSCCSVNAAHRYPFNPKSSNMEWQRQAAFIPTPDLTAPELQSRNDSGNVGRTRKQHACNKSALVWTYHWFSSLSFYRRLLSRSISPEYDQIRNKSGTPSRISNIGICRKTL